MKFIHKDRLVFSPITRSSSPFFFFFIILTFYQIAISDILCLTWGQSSERILKKMSYECPGPHTVHVVNYMEGHECGSNIIRQTVCSHAGSSLRRWGSALASTSTSALFIYLAPFIHKCVWKVLHRTKNNTNKTDNNNSMIKRQTAK